MRWLLLLLLISCSPSTEEGGIQAFFCQEENCEDLFLASLGNSTEISCAFYDLELESIENMLAKKDARVKLHNKTYGLMHHKFCVLDGKQVIAGSMNPTHNGVFKNDNVLLFMESETLADVYQNEFENLEKKSARGTSFLLSGIPVTVRFCPQEDCEGLVLQELRKAEKSIKFMTFTFTSDPIGDALLDAADRNVVVEGVFEKRQGKKYSEFQKLKDWGLNVTYDANPATMHHKTFIIDEKTVITGSFNPTLSATTKNDENLLVIHDKNLANEFIDEFIRIRKISTS